MPYLPSHNGLKLFTFHHSAYCYAYTLLSITVLGVHMGAKTNRQLLQQRKGVLAFANHDLHGGFVSAGSA
jgi:hypothetical protein